MKRRLYMKRKVLFVFLAVIIVAVTFTLTFVLLSPSHDNSIKIDEKEPDKNVPQSVSDDEVTPPSNGFYVASSGTAHELVGSHVEFGQQIGMFGLNSVYVGSTSIYDGAPATFSDLPVVLYKSSEGSLSSIKLIKMDNYAGIGFTISDDKLIITEVVDNSPASEVGLQVDDIVVSVNGQATRGDMDSDNLLYDYCSYGMLNSVLKLQVLRGTTTFDIEMPLWRLYYVDNVSYKLIAKGDYVQLIIDGPVDPGNYAYYIADSGNANSGTAYCFFVKSR